MRWYVASLLHWFLRETDFITMIKKIRCLFHFYSSCNQRVDWKGCNSLVWLGSKFGKKLVRMNFTLLLEIFFAVAVRFRKHKSFFILCFHIKKNSSCHLWIGKMDQSSKKKKLKCKTVKLDYPIMIPKFLDLKEMFTSIIIPASSCFLDIITPIFT